MNLSLLRFMLTATFSPYLGIATSSSMGMHTRAILRKKKKKKQNLYSWLTARHIITHRKDILSQIFLGDESRYLTHTEPHYSF